MDVAAGNPPVPGTGYPDTLDELVTIVQAYSIVHQQSMAANAHMSSR